LAVEPSFRQIQVRWEESFQQKISFATNLPETIDTVSTVFLWMKVDQLENLKDITLERVYTGTTSKHQVPVKFVEGSDIHKIAITYIAE
jgi:hypothetical protein